ncbi:phosphotransferase enzyme family protein [Planctomyces sp. SH-PL14]|uniref:phosphotransferase enzyme family protein n=1 Tax=Planctomyces sp. SH-PL14 TaxID=1632864 RepID=UPI00078DF474|nr:phosphotransferase [Planctomyces sp. SH-PL14]AMV18481.1 serine/threonine protein kinase [Planctomyces sp. SH-PL14]
MLDRSLLTRLGRPFGFQADELRWIRSSQNHVYECGSPDDPAVLRVSSGRSRTLAEVEAELDWIENLARQDVPVCRARLSSEGQRCHVVSIDGKDYLVVCFDRAPGRAVEIADLTPEFHARLGEVTARLHAAVFDDRTAAADSTSARAPWHASRLLNGDIERYTAASVGGFRAAARSLVARLAPQVEHRLGLLHADISFSNVFVDDGRLTLFDFDNCEHGPIEQDFATILYDSIYCRLLNRVPADELAARIGERWDAFLAGYRGVRPHVEIDADLLRQFLILREAIIYTHYCRTVDLAAVRESFREGMDEMRRNVEAGATPVLDVTA